MSRPESDPAISRRQFAVRFAGTAALACTIPGVFASSDGAVELSGIVAGASGKHSIYIALWDADGFLKKPSQQLRVDPPAAPQFRFRVRPGRWALSAFEDVNGNGVLDMGMFGPKEPSGFWRAFHAWRKPQFNDVAVQIERDTPNIEIKLAR